jgi:hypothetical protein
MESKDLLTDAYGHIKRIVHQAVEGLEADQLAWRPEEGSNSIAWLVWHLTRIQDGHLATTTRLEEAWIIDGWASKFGKDADRTINGQGDGPAEVAALQADADTLLGYHDFVHGRTANYLASMDSDDLERIIDTSYDPPVKAGIRLVSIIQDNMQHAGQARYLRGTIDRTFN